MAASTTKVGRAFQRICGFCFRPTTRIGYYIGNPVMTYADRKMTCTTNQGPLNQFVATTTYAVKQDEQQISSTHNSLILPEDSKRESLVNRVKEAILHSLKFRKMFAVVYLGGKQFRIAQNDIIMTSKIAAKCGDKIKLQKVLMLGGKEFSLIGKPLLRNIHIEATVLEKTKGRNVIVFKKKRRKNYKKWREHRQDLTVLRINKLHLDPDQIDL